MATKPYELGNADKKQPAVIQSLKSGAESPFSAKEVSFLQASEAAKKGEWRLAVWCEDMSLAKNRAKDLNARACIGPRTLPPLPKKEEPGSPVVQMVDWKPEKPGQPKKAKSIKAYLHASAKNIGDLLMDHSDFDDTDQGIEVVDKGTGQELADKYPEAWEYVQTQMSSDMYRGFLAGPCYYIKYDGFTDSASPFSIVSAAWLESLPEGHPEDFNAAKKPRFAGALIKKPVTVKAGLREVRVTFADGNTITTSMAAGLSDEDILKYYAVGNKFNIGAGEEDNVQAVAKVDILAAPFEKCAKCQGNIGSANITLAGHPGKKFCSDACVNAAYAELNPRDKRGVQDVGDKSKMSGAKTSAGKRREARVKAGFGDTEVDQATRDKVQAEMAAILKKLKAKVARYGLQETLGQTEVRKFHDDCLKGKFGKMAYHQAAKFEDDLRTWVESINP